MTKAAALHAFFNTITTAYASTSVVDSVPAEYLTYTGVSGMYGDGKASITVNIYVDGGKEARANALAQALSDAIGRGGKFLACDNGAIWIQRGKPFCQSLIDPTDRYLIRRYVNLYAEFLTDK